MAERAAKLRFQDTVCAGRGRLAEKLRPAGRRPGAGPGQKTAWRAGSRSTARNLFDAVRRAAWDAASSEDDRDNAGTDALAHSRAALGTASAAARCYGQKLQPFSKAGLLAGQPGLAKGGAPFAGDGLAASNPLSRWRQKQGQKARHAAARAGQAAAAGGAKGSAGAAKGVSSAADKLASLVKPRAQVIWFFLIAGLLAALLAGLFASCGALVAGSGNALLGTSFTAEESDILAAEGDFAALELALDAQLGGIEAENPGYDEYRYDLAEIGHDPYALAACLTVLFEDYTQAQVQGTLQSLFARQYTLTLTPETETRTRTETRTGTSTYTDSKTGKPVKYEYDYQVEVAYEYHILHVKLENQGLAAAVRTLGLTKEQQERFSVLLSTGGGRPGQFAWDVPGVSGGAYMDYDIPGDALTDERFRRMIAEGERYLGYPYVWGGSSPDTSFDCSGFVSWVINHCGNGWSVGRLTAKGLMGVCDILPRDEAQPGDLVFFQGTYSTSGASHVGIYAGGGMMLHCGDPISYASIDSSCWQEHFLCFGRIPN